MSRYPQMSNQTRAKFKALAKPDCPECDGEGVLAICSNNNPDTERDIRCDCVELEYDGPDDGEAWSGGFASNH